MLELGSEVGLSLLLLLLSVISDFGSRKALPASTGCIPLFASPLLIDSLLQSSAFVDEVAGKIYHDVA